MSKGFVAAEQGHIMQLLHPAQLTAAGTCDTFLMEGWGHATIIIDVGAGSGCSITVHDSIGFGGTSHTSLTFRSAQDSTDAGDLMEAALAWASSLTIAAGTGGVAVIELDGDELPDGYPYVTVRTSAVGGKYLGIIGILSGGRYQKDITATAVS